jgi:N-acyl homoserine lactone hydrolase
MSLYEIYPLEVGYFPDQDQSKVTFLKGAGTKGYSPCIVYVVKGEGVTFLVDTGVPDPEYSEKYFHTVVQPEEMRLLNALKKIDVKLGDIEFVVLTHLHWDHIFNNGLFKGKKMYVQKSEIDFALDPWPIFRHAYEHFKCNLTPHWFESIPDFEYVYGDTDIAPGVKLLHMPGHSPGSQGVLVDTSDGKYLIAGDAIPSYVNWETPGHQMIGVFSSMEDQLNTFKKLENIEGLKVLPSHDGRVLEHECYPY